MQTDQNVRQYFLFISNHIGLLYIPKVRSAWESADNSVAVVWPFPFPKI